MSRSALASVRDCVRSVLRRDQLRFLATLLGLFCAPGLRADALPMQTHGTTISALDGEKQPLLYWAPENADKVATPLFVFLHSWSSDFTQDNSKWFRECVRYKWIWLHPNFRGINQSPKACGSRFARQDILDAIEFARGKWKIDPERIYLAGVSGGGHMSLLMAGHHPNQFSAISSWVGPNDLIEWHRFHTKDGMPQKYAQMIEASLGGPPGKSPEIDADYRDRSPVFHLHRAKDLPTSIWAGVQDGHAGSVPVSHSLIAFNRIAKANGDSEIAIEEIEQLVRQKKLTAPTESDQVSDVTLGREILLRRRSGNSVATIFEGGHESIPEAAFAWLDLQRRRAVDFIGKDE